MTTDTIRIGSQASPFTSFTTIGATAATGSPFAGVGGCELNNFTALNSIFQCAVGLLPGAVQPAMLAAVNSVNGGYLASNVSGQGQQAEGQPEIDRRQQPTGGVHCIFDKAFH